MSNLDLLPRADLPVMKKCECEACGYIARTVQKWIDACGAPICPCNSQVMKIDLGEGE